MRAFQVAHRRAPARIDNGHHRLVVLVHNKPGHMGQQRLPKVVGRYNLGVEWLTHDCRLLCPEMGKQELGPLIARWRPEVDRKVV